MRFGNNRLPRLMWIMKGGAFMWYWILLFIIPIVILAFFEEMIYFFVNRTVFGRSKLEEEWRKRAKQLMSVKKKVS